MTAANTEVKISDTMSEELVVMIDIWVTGFVTVTELPRKIMEKAFKEGFDKETIRQVIVSKLKAWAIGQDHKRQNAKRVKTEKLPRNKKKSE